MNIRRTLFGGAVGGLALAMLSAVSGTAVAQVAPQPGGPGCSGDPSLAPFLPFASGSAVNALVSAINTANTAFLTQGTAFIGSPPNPAPGQEGGGVWVRGIGGDINSKSTTSTTNITLNGNPAAGPINCASSLNLKFTGVQAGTDVARLNINGWNFHVGATVGYLSAKATDTTAPGALNPGGGTLTNSLDVPFAGVYAAATYGSFFVDGQIRWDYYQNRLNDPATGLFNQGLDARGVTLTANAGYNAQLGEGWFIEPSAGIVISKVKVDPLNVAGTLFLQNSPNVTFPGQLRVGDIDSTLGRLSIRAGKTIVGDKMIWQPFATVSVYREFAGAVQSSFTTGVDAGGLVLPNLSGNISTSRVGTYGQFALGIAGQVVNTGWLGYLRADYRKGDNIDGYSLNGGLRYQFTPDAAPMAPKGLITKAPPMMMATAVNWTGLYIGANFGVDAGWSNWNFPGPNTTTAPKYAGALAGGQIGYNLQNGKWILGVEGMVDWANAHGARECPNGFLFSCEMAQSMFSTVTARVGYAFWDRAFVYLKGGLAVARETASYKCNTDNQVTVNVVLVGCPGNGDTRTRVGWTIGYGSEFALTQNWSVKSETSYFDLGTNRYSLPQTATTPGSVSGAPADVDVRSRGITSIIGVNYRFNAGPVAARY